MSEGLESTGELAKYYKDRLEEFVRKTKWCPKCHYPLKFEGPCPTCAENDRIEAEQKREEYEKTVRRLGGIRAYEDYTFEKLDSRYYDSKRAAELCAGFPNENLYIWGERGVGKTHLGVATIRLHPKALSLKPAEILRKMRGLALDAKEEKKTLTWLIDHPCLMIDDLGTEKLTEYASSIMYEIIDGRYMNKRKGMLITSNYDLNSLSQRMEDDRVASRLAGMCRIIKLSGNDRRTER